MLSRTHVRPFLREVEEAGQVPRLEVDFLRDRDGRTVAFLGRLCRLVRRLEGRPRGTVLEALRRQERRVGDVRRLDGISKALLDRARFEPPTDAERAPELREALFRARGRSWPPTPGSLRTPYREVARQTGLAEERVQALLYADRPDARLLVRAPRLDGTRLLALYNLELARGVLLDASRLTLTARGGWRGIFRAVKLARLMYRIRREGKAYRVELTGPAASYVVRARRYGARLARVVPALSRAPGWRLEAQIEGDGGGFRFELDGTAPVAGSRGRGRPRHDSSFERSLARDFARKLGEEREGWTLEREGTPVAVGEEVFLPDFTFRHGDGREALVEIVGFWTPEYLERKIRTVRELAPENLILVVYEALDTGGDDGEESAAARLEAEAPGRVLWFARQPRIREVMEAVEGAARKP